MKPAWPADERAPAPPILTPGIGLPETRAALRGASFWFDALIFAATVVYIVFAVIVLATAPLWIGRLW